MGNGGGAHSETATLREEGRALRARCGVLRAVLFIVPGNVPPSTYDLATRGWGHVLNRALGASVARAYLYILAAAQGIGPEQSGAMA